MEEIGVNFGNYFKVGFSEDFFEKENKHYITLYFATIDVDPNIEIINMEPDKCEGWDWYNLNNLPKPLFEPCDISIDSYKTGKNYYDKE